MKLLAMLVLFSSSSIYAATSDVLNLKGIVDEVLSIEVTPDLIAQTLPLNISQNNTRVAVVEERSNIATGYKVTISSINFGKLVRTGGTEIFPYTLSYDNQVLYLSADVVQTNAPLTTNNFKIKKRVKISYTGVDAENMVAGTYTDAITFAIAPN